MTDPCVTVLGYGIAIATGSNLRRDLEVDETTIDRDAMGRLATALAMLEGQALSTLSTATFC
jgi:hypothetical protein